MDQFIKIVSDPRACFIYRGVTGFCFADFCSQQTEIVFIVFFFSPSFISPRSSGQKLMIVRRAKKKPKKYKPGTMRFRVPPPPTHTLTFLIFFLAKVNRCTTWQDKWTELFRTPTVIIHVVPKTCPCHVLHCPAETSSEAASTACYWIIFSLSTLKRLFEDIQWRSWWFFFDSVPQSHRIESVDRNLIDHDFLYICLDFHGDCIEFELDRMWLALRSRRLLSRSSVDLR